MTALKSRTALYNSVTTSADDEVELVIKRGDGIINVLITELCTIPCIQSVYQVISCKRTNHSFSQVFHNLREELETFTCTAAGHPLLKAINDRFSALG